MVARISIGETINGALSYNEHKIQKEHAKIILASGFACDIGSLGFSQKLRRFNNLIELRPRVKKNTLHISLNFSPDDNITTDKMQAIARDYMEKIGFSAQPFLVYRHLDTNHPHMHIVTTNIRAKGRPISLHNIARDKSESARKAIELEYDLIEAESRGKKAQRPPRAIDLLPALYGKEETKHVITGTVGMVLQSYKFASFSEFNAILRDFNIVADRGNPGSRTYEKGGIVYSILDEKGGRIGRPIKASDIYGAPTLKTIEEKYALNLVKKIALNAFVQKGLTDSMTYSRTAAQFLNNLSKRKQGLQFLLGQDFQIGEAFLIDHRKKTAFKVEELGCSIGDLFKKLGAPDKDSQTYKPLPSAGNRQNVSKVRRLKGFRYRTFQPFHIIIRILFSPTRTYSGGAAHVHKRKKKKKRRPPL
jgi:Relaxase/Mobilisation nuclease domain